MDLENPGLTLGLAMAAGVVAQILARHLSIPGIVILLASGVLLGPDVAGLVRPELLGTALPALVGFAVAVILFAGGMNLDVRRLREERIAIRRLVTSGAILTGVGAAAAAMVMLGWEWRLAALFGSLMTVTGPTVVTPLVRRLRLKEPVGTILEAEGVLIDPVGAIIAVVALEVLYAGGSAFTATVETAAAGLGAGALMGLAAGGAIVLLLRPRRLVPSGLENVLVLAVVMFTFQMSEAVRSESGLAAIVVAGLVVGNVETRVSRELLEFKEQLTVLMIGVLFVLLAADVRLADIQALGVGGLLTVAALIVVVRPLQVWICTRNAGLGWQERTFMAAMAPRGIVAAAVASLFAQYMAERGLPGGDALRALVFLVIAGTVTIYGFGSGWLASALGLRQRVGKGFVFLGANALSVALARVMELDPEDAAFVDTNSEHVNAVRALGFRVIHGHGLDPEVIRDAEPQARVGCIAVTPNDEVNLLFARSVREETRAPALWVAIRQEAGGIPSETVRAAHAGVLFGRPCNLEHWIVALEAGSIEIQIRVRTTPSRATTALNDEPSLLILAVRRRGRRIPYDDTVPLEARSEIAVAVDTARRADAEATLQAHGFTESVLVPQLVESRP